MIGMTSKLMDDLTHDEYEAHLMEVLKNAASVNRAKSHSGGMKHDQQKSRLDLLDSVFLEGVGNVLRFGADKYAAHNWRKGISVSRLTAASLRHVIAFNDGHDVDEESGLSHLYHAGCCLMFLARMMQDRPDLDDRYKPE